MRNISQRRKKRYSQSSWLFRVRRVACWSNNSQKVQFGVLVQIRDKDGFRPFGVLLDLKRRVCFFDHCEDFSLFNKELK